MVDGMKDLPSFLTSFSLNEIERLRPRVMAVTVSIGSGLVLKPERLPLVVALQYRGLCSQRGKHPWSFLAGRSHDDTERVRTLSGAVWPLPRGPHRWGAVYEARRNMVTSEYPSYGCPASQRQTNPAPRWASVSGETASRTRLKGLLSENVRCSWP